MTNEKIMSTICDSICRHPYRVESQAELDILCEDCVVNKLEASDGDLISRADAIRKCCGEKCGCEREECGYTEACSEVMRLESLPSAESVQGEWMWTEHDDPCYFRCSNCGRMSDEDSDFCPNCGVRMYKGGEDEKVKTEMSLPNWIPCSERLPEEETDVLVTRRFLGCKDGSRGWNAHIPPKTYVEVAQYFNGEWTALSDEYKVARSRHTNPVAWMPLPKPYEGSESDEVD